MSIASLIKRMREVGAPMEAIELAVSAVEEVEARFAAAEEARKASQRQRTAKHRAFSRDRNVTVTSQQRDPAPKDNNQTPTPENSPSDPKGSSAPKGAKPPRKARKSPNVPLPADWQPGAESEATRIELGRSREWMLETAAQMRCWAEGGDHHRAKWDQVHCGWMRREAQREPQQTQRARNGPQPRPVTAQQRSLDLARQAHLELTGDPDDPGPFTDDATARFADGGYSNGHARPGFHEQAGGQFRLAPPRPSGPPRPH